MNALLHRCAGEQPRMAAKRRTRRMSRDQADDPGSTTDAHGSTRMKRFRCSRGRPPTPRLRRARPPRTIRGDIPPKAVRTRSAWSPTEFTENTDQAGQPRSDTKGHERTRSRLSSPLASGLSPLASYRPSPLVSSLPPHAVSGGKLRGAVVGTGGAMSSQLLLFLPGWLVRRGRVAGRNKPPRT